MAHPFWTRPRGTQLRFGLLYFSEGAPIGFLWWALPTLLRAEGVAIERITALTAALVVPWTLKFLWAPLIDAGRNARWGFRAWAMSAQAAMGLCLVPLFFVDPTENFHLWFWLLLAHAFCAATQDVAIDALAVTSVTPEQRGRVNAAMQAGMLSGRSLFGGGALVLAATWGWNAILVALILAIWASLVVLWRCTPEPAPPTATGQAPWLLFGRTLYQAFSRKLTWLGLGFALTAGAAFEATGALAGPMLIDQEISVATTGVFFGLPVVAAMLSGSLLGGWLADRGAGRRERLLGWTQVGLAGSVVLLGVALMLGLGGGGSMALLTLVYLGIGLFTAVSYAWFMDLTDPRIGGTQFSTYMAATNGCEAWAAWTAGRLAGTFGYGPGLVGMALISFAALGWLRATKTPRG
jgi:MFS family permease